MATLDFPHVVIKKEEEEEVSWLTNNQGSEENETFAELPDVIVKLEEEEEPRVPYRPGTEGSKIFHVAHSGSRKSSSMGSRSPPLCRGVEIVIPHKPWVEEMSKEHFESPLLCHRSPSAGARCQSK
ncbi:UNVERIFIED_CONTAM: hypothetical protein K2H54_061274, partial [Gekko kuhli]